MNCYIPHCIYFYDLVSKIDLRVTMYELVTYNTEQWLYFIPYCNEGKLRPELLEYWMPMANDFHSGHQTFTKLQYNAQIGQ